MTTKYQIERENNVLRSMISRYAQYLPTCPVMHDKPLCDCGYNEAIRAMRDAVWGMLGEIPSQLPQNKAALEELK